MKSVKPGRGPSMMGGIMSIFMGAFGIVWTIIAASMAGGVFTLFGVIFIVIAIVMAVYNFKNATSKNRYSAFDITDSSEESDPLNDRFGVSHEKTALKNENLDDDSKFCPYCGTSVKEDYEFCNKCGKKLP